MNKQILQLKISLAKTREAALNYALATDDEEVMNIAIGKIKMAEEKLDAAAAAMEEVQSTIEAMVSFAPAGGGTAELTEDERRLRELAAGGEQHA